MTYRAWCNGGHGDPDESVIPGRLPDGWLLQAASCFRISGEVIWYADPAARLQVITCPEHRLEAAS